MTWLDFWWPFLRTRHHLAPFPLPFAPGPSDLREWNVEAIPPEFTAPTPLPASGRLVASLHRLLIEVGIAMTPATSSWDPRSWYALYQYGSDFAETAPLLRFYSEMRHQDPRLTARGSEDIASGITCYLAREHLALDHIADVYACIQRGELRYVDPDLGIRPDYFCEDADHLTVIVESKGATGTRSAITSRIDPDGWNQVQNVAPVNLSLRARCGRVVIGTHFCIDGIHRRSETTTILKDPEGEPSVEKEPDSDAVIRLSYAKALRFMGHDVLADRLLAGRKLPEHPDRVPQSNGLPVVPLGLTPFGNTIGLYGPVTKALFSNATSSVRDAVTESLRDFRSQRTAVESVGYALPNGVVVIYDPDDLM